MQFRILGPLEALERDVPQPLGGAKQRAVLAILLLHGGELASGERLADELWGERPPATAAKTLQGYISRLRKTLGEDVLRTRGRGYVLTLPSGQLDLDEFERLAGEGRNALSAGDAATAAERLRGALGLWRGPPLADFTYEPFAQAEIARLEEARLASLEDRIEADLALGRHGQVVAELERLVREHPVRERLRGQLMLSLYRTGRQADALECYRIGRRAMIDELGIEPGRALQDLEAAILRHDAALDPPAEATASPRAVSTAETARIRGAIEASRAAFVGRERELNELTVAFDDACAGRGRLVLLVGEPGIGKSRLGEELLAHARERGALLLVGRCWEAGGAPAYWPFVQALRAYARDRETAALRAELGEGAADLARIIPDLRQRFVDLADPSGPDSEGARFRVFDATARFLHNVSNSRPVVLALDDLHAADTPSLLLLRFLARELGSMRVLILGAFRDVDPIPGEPLAETISEVTREPVTRRLTLAGLSESEIEQYVQLTASELASSELVAALQTRTEGNPLFVGEIVRLLSIEGASTSGGGAGVAIPQSVREVIARRLSHLSPECYRGLALASVIGREFALDALAGAAGEADQVLESLHEATVARVLSEIPGDRGRLRFVHVLIRDTLYGGLGVAARMRLHRQVGQALEALYGDQPGPHLAELAHHFSLAGSGLTEKAVEYATRAAERAARLLAFEESARLYQLALELGGAGIGGEHRCELLLALGDVQARVGDMDAAMPTFADAAQLARELGSGERLARAALGYGGRFPFVRAGMDERLMPLLEEGLAALDSRDSPLRARLLTRLAGARRGEASREPAAALAREAIDVARRTGDLATVGYVLEGTSLARFESTTPEHRLAVGAEMLSIAQREGDKERAVLGRMFRFMTFVELGDLAQAQLELTEMNSAATELRQPAQRVVVLVCQAMVALLTGALDDAEKLMHDVLRLGERAETWAVAWHRLQLCALRREQGRLAELEQTVQRSVTEQPSFPIWRCVLTHLHAATGNLDKANDELETLAEDKFSTLPVDEEWTLGMSLLSEVAVGLGNLSRAQTLYQLLIPYSQRVVCPGPEVSTGAVSRYLGRLACSMSRWEEAEQHFQHALELNARIHARPWLARTQIDCARMLRLRGAPADRARSSELLAEAVATFHALGMTSHADRASTLELPSTPDLVW